MPHAPGRRKACQRCVTDKRRCDLRRPACARCASAGKQCTYAASSERLEEVPIVGRLALANGQHARLLASEEEDEDNFESLSYPPRDFALTIRLPPSRLRYCARMIRKFFVSDWVEFAQTPFIKPLSPGLNLPPPLQEAYSACAVYISRSENNRPVIGRIVVDTYSNLLHQNADCGLEMELATVQATLLLHIVSLFDDDVEFHTSAEKRMDTVRAKVLHLQRTASKTSEQCSEASQYREWFILESIRRTILAATFIEGIYTNITQGFCQTVAFLSILQITVAGKLWRAGSEAEWSSLSKVTPHTVLPYGEAVGWWREEAVERKLDGLQQLLWVACKGLRETPNAQSRPHP